MKLNVMVSAGVHKSHLIAVASELYNLHNIAVTLYTSLYPTAKTKAILSKLGNTSSMLLRFLDREESLPDASVFQYPLAEVIVKACLALRDINPPYVQQQAESILYFFYAKHGAHLVNRNNPDIYHYRSCFGFIRDFSSKLNCTLVCDHTIAHPKFISKQLFALRTLDNPFDSNSSEPESDFRMPFLFRLMNNELDEAKHILVNSDFVRDTCIHYGIQSSKIKVLYLGCDSRFLSFLPTANPPSSERRTTFLFAGNWSIRKGAHVIEQMLLDTGLSIELRIAGATKDDIIKTTPNIFSSNAKILPLGYLSRHQLALEMLKAKFFIFPSLCEGSARVVFEALAAGCYVITTPFAGSIVESDVHGQLCQPGSPDSLYSAILIALDQSDLRYDEISHSNAGLVSSTYTHAHYARSLSAYYYSLLS